MSKPYLQEIDSPGMLFPNPGTQKLYGQLLETLYLVLEESGERLGTPIKHPEVSGFDPGNPAQRVADGGQAFLRFVISRLELQRDGAYFFLDLDACRHSLGVVEEMITLFPDTMNRPENQPEISGIQQAIVRLRDLLLDEYGGKLHLVLAQPTAAVS